MNTTSTRRPAYTVGQRVEVLACDFTVAGMPRLWTAGTVAKVTAFDDKKLDVMVVADRGTFHPQVVGVRGGNKNIRPL